MEHLTPLLVVIRLAGAALAAVLVVLSLRAWRKTHDARMMRLIAGFALILFGILVEGLSFQLLFPGDLMTAHLIEAATQLVALGILIWALF